MEDSSKGVEDLCEEEHSVWVRQLLPEDRGRNLVKALLAFTSNVPSSVCQRKFNLVLSNGTVDYIKTHDLIHCPIST